jgi:hypothetical protein
MSVNQKRTNSMFSSAMRPSTSCADEALSSVVAIRLRSFPGPAVRP